MVVLPEEQPVDDFVYVKTAESEGPVLHSTQKPIELGRYLIKTYTKPGDVILDNFFYLGVPLSGRVIRSKSSLRCGLSTSIPNAIKSAA